MLSCGTAAVPFSSLPVSHCYRREKDCRVLTLSSKTLPFASMTTSSSLYLQSNGSSPVLAVPELPVAQKALSRNINGN